MKAIEGKLKGNGLKIAVVAAKFNDFISKRLLEGCLDQLSKLGVLKKDIKIVWVPGSFEIPVVAQKLAKKKTIDAVICLGAVIRGETYHFECVSNAATYGILRASLDNCKPVIFGVLTTDTVNQAYARCEEDGDNKGRDAAIAAVEMSSVLSQL